MAGENRISAINNFISGAAAGGAQIVVGYPFDTVKVNMQVGNTVAGSVIKAPSTPMACVRSIYRTEGMKGFFKGMSSPMAGSLVFNSILFGCFEEFKRMLTPAGQEPTPAIFITAAMLTGVAESSVYCPTELIKTRMQTMHAGTQVGVADVVRDIVKTRGVRGLFMGLTPTLMREMPGNAIYFSSYEFFKGLVPATWGLSATSIMAGGMAGIAYWTTQFPMDVIKTRMQADSLHNPRYRGVAHCASLIVREEGLRNMFRGLSPCLLRAFPANAAAFYVFEVSRASLNDMSTKLVARFSTPAVMDEHPHEQARV